MMDELKKFWDSLPKEVKVAGYITASYAISEGLKGLSGLELNSTILTFVVNILIVFLEETKKRLDNRKKK